MFVLKKFFLYEKDFNRKTLFYRVWHNKVLPLARQFLCLTLQKIVFWSLPSHIWAQFWEQIANDYTLKDNFCITTIHSKVWLSNCGTFENATKNFFDFMIIWANSNNNKKLVKVWIYMTNSCTVEVETRIYIHMMIFTFHNKLLWVYTKLCVLSKSSEEENDHTIEEGIIKG